MSEPVHISEVLPDVLANITQRMDARTQELRAQEKRERQTRICDAVGDFYKHGLLALRAKPTPKNKPQDTLFSISRSKRL